MTQIKSERAKEYVETKFTLEYDDTERYFLQAEEVGATLVNGLIGRCRRYADKAVSIAETEAEERHIKKIEKININNLIEFRNKAICAFCDLCSADECLTQIDEKCDILRIFIKKLDQE